MDPNAVVLEISSDEDDIWNDDNRTGVSDSGDDDHNWLTDLLDEVNKQKYGDDSDEIVVVSESEKTEKKMKLKTCLVELDDDDCVVLENDPNEPVSVRNDNRSNGGGDGDGDDLDEIVVVSEKGQVACRDYPHSRHLCIKFPFSTTPNQSHCEQCYCYVCDSLGPCIYWGNGSTSTDHCHATDKDELWRHKRKTAKNDTKTVQPVHKVADSLLLNRLHPVDRHKPGPGPALVQPRSHTSTNFQTPNIISQHRSHLLSLRNKFHPDLVSHYLKTNVVRTNTNYNLRTQIQRPVLKKTRLAGVYRGNFGNSSRHQNHHLNGTLPGGNNLNNLNNYLGSPLPTIAVNTSNNLNPKFQSQINSNPLYQQPYLGPPLPPRPQVATSQLSSIVPAQQSYPVSSQNQLHPVSDYTQNSSNGTQAQSPVIDPDFKENDLNLSTKQDSVTPEATNESSSSPAAIPDGLTNYDWIFDSQPVEQGFMDLHGVYGLNDFSSDSSFIDTGPMFHF